MFRIWVPDFDSRSYFAAIAAVEFGLFQAGRHRTSKQALRRNSARKRDWIKFAEIALMRGAATKIGAFLLRAIAITIRASSSSLLHRWHRLHRWKTMYCQPARMNFG
jgi:hypothetical protein